MGAMTPPSGPEPPVGRGSPRLPHPTPNIPLTKTTNPLLSHAFPKRPDLDAPTPLPPTPSPQRFDIQRIVVTVRFPPLQALSNYRYRGWLVGDLARTSVSKDAGGYAEALGRFVAKMQVIAARSNHIVACPTERLHEPLLDRFCRACFDTVPDLLSQPQYSPSRRQNQSIPWAFAHALWQEVSRVHPAIVKSWTRSIIVKAAQSYPLPSSLIDCRAPGPNVLDGDRLRATLPAYRIFLRSYGVPDDEADSALIAAQGDLEKLLQTPQASDADMKIAVDAARDVVSQMTASTTP